MTTHVLSTFRPTQIAHVIKLGALALGLVLGACDVPSKNIGDETDASSGGTMCTPGEQMPAEDGCNTCTCTEGGSWACTEIACESDTGMGMCTPGETMPDPNSCGTCSCTEDAEWVCSAEPCMECTPGEMMPSEDGCNTCTCTEEGAWACTEEACPPLLIDNCLDMDPMQVDPYFLTSADLTGDILTVDVTTSGGCAEHLWGACWLNNPEQLDPELASVQVLLTHDSMGDPCEAEISETFEYDISEIKLYWQDTRPAAEVDLGMDHVFVYEF